jgi:hypothetical protein
VHALLRGDRAALLHCCALLVEKVPAGRNQHMMSQLAPRAAAAVGLLAAAAWCACSASAPPSTGGGDADQKTKKKKKKKWVEEVLPEERKAELTGRIDAWHTAQQQRGASEPLHFEASLSAGERKFIHALCESRGTEMSSKSEGEGKERHVVVYDVPVEAGTVGGVSAARRAELESRLDAWRAGAMAAALHFEPGPPAEREFVHQLAAKHGLASKSEGKTHHGPDWHIVVRRN